MAELIQLERSAVDLLPCGTCVQHHGIEIAVGAISDMDSIIREIVRSE